MKKFAITLLAATILAAPIAQARDDHRGPDRGRHIERSAPHHKMSPHKKVIVQKHRWSRGHRMSASERRRMQEVRDYRRHRLSAPPRGHRWVRIDNDFLLVGITSGIISSIIAGR